MKDSLKERLWIRSLRPSQMPSWKLCRDALARIEELELEILSTENSNGNLWHRLRDADATIAKLEGEIETLRGDLVTGNSELLDQAEAVIATLQGKLDRARDTINKVFGIAYPHPSRTFDTMIKDMGLIDDLCRSILSDLSPEKRCRDANLKAYHEARATIAKLEGENERLRGIDEWIDNELSKVTMLESRVTDRDETIATFQGKLDRAVGVLQQNQSLLLLLIDMGLGRLQTPAEHRFKHNQSILSDLLPETRNPRIISSACRQAASLIERQAAEIDNLQMVLDDTAREREEWNGKHQQACLEIERQAAEIAYWKEQATELGRTRQRNEAEIERQAAEIDGERAIASGWHKRWKEAQAEIERLRKALDYAEARALQITEASRAALAGGGK